MMRNYTEPYHERFDEENRVRFEGKAGHIYVVENDSMPGLFKIGMTTRAVIEERIDELSIGNTSIPTQFKLVHKQYTEHVYETEQNIHEKLARYNVGKEFFIEQFWDVMWP